MQHQRDRNAADTLRSFSDALTQSRAALEHEEQRLTKSQQLYHEITQKNETLRTCHVRNPDVQQRLEALRRERLRLRSYTQRQRDELVTVAGHVAQLRMPRIELEARQKAAKENLMTMRRQYTVRAAHVHAQLAQASLQGGEERLHCQSIPYLRKTAQRKERELSIVQEAVSAAEAKRDAQAQRIMTLAEVLDTEKEYRRRLSGDACEGGAATGEDTDTAAASAADHLSLQHRNNPEKSNVDTACVDQKTAIKEEEQAKGEEEERNTLHDTPLALEELEVQLESVRAARVTETQEQEKAMAVLQETREGLKARVRALCEAVEAMDSAQQAAQSAMHEALNEAGGCTAGGSVLCCECSTDILSQFL